jgi:thioesterase domain-containing protein/acyl carrier protein
MLLPIAARETAADDARLANDPLAPHRTRALVARLREQIAARLPAYMMPAAFVVLDALPRTRAGKLDTRALPAPQTAVLDSAVYRAPRTDTERVLAQLFAEVLGRERVGVQDSFFELGGHSLLVVRLMARVRDQLGIDLPLATLFARPTVAALALAIDSPALTPASAGDAALVTLRTGGGTPFYCVAPVAGVVFPYLALARHLPDGLQFHGLQPFGLDAGATKSVESMAEAYADIISRVQPDGAIAVGGWSFGALVALELAQRLTERGRVVSLVVLVDPQFPGGSLSWLDRARLGYDVVVRGLPFVRDYVRMALSGDRAAPALRPIVSATLAGFAAAVRYRPIVYAGPVTIFRSEATVALTGEADDAWRRVACGKVQVKQFPGTHMTLLQEPHVAALAHALGNALRGANAGYG